MTQRGLHGRVREDIILLIAHFANQLAQQDACVATADESDAQTDSRRVIRQRVQRQSLRKRSTTEQDSQG